MSYTPNDIGNWIVTAGANKWDFANPKFEAHHISDFVEGAAKEPRFSGQTPGVFYSVAQHCVLVASLCPPGFELEGLLHDLHEGMYKDISTPFKLLMPQYKQYEDLGAAALRRYFGVPEVNSPEVKKADWMALLIERRDLIPEHMGWPSEEMAGHGRVRPQPWQIASAVYMEKLNKLTNQRRAA